MAERKQTFSISELAQEFQVSTRTIRFYEEKGYIQPRRDGQRRIYSAADRTRIRLILRGKRIGMSLAESMEIIDMYSSGENSASQLEALLARVTERRNALEQQRDDLNATLSALGDIEENCRTALRAQGGNPKATARANARS